MKVFALSLALIASPTLAFAASSVDAAGVLDITFESSFVGSNAVVTCELGFIKVNSVDPDSGPASCAAIRAITVVGSLGNDRIELNSLTSLTMPALRSTSLNGNNGDDTIRGSFAADIIDGESGNDLLEGYDGKDKIYGDSGNDTIYGGNGNDTLKGESGNDRIFGQNGNDKLYGNSGNDYLRGGKGDDSADGGSGSNSVKK